MTNATVEKPANSNESVNSDSPDKDAVRVALDFIRSVRVPESDKDKSD